MRLYNSMSHIEINRTSSNFYVFQEVTENWFLDFIEIIALSNGIGFSTRGFVKYFVCL